jgi:glycosyltransferase involved in cell wall biosynthesis
MNILLSAYACRPGAGSEPATGWGWAIHLAQAGCQVYLFTAGRNRIAIEAYLREHPCPELHAYFIEVPGMNPMSSGALHYILWQYFALRFARSLQATVTFDLVHHVSYGTVVIPTPLARLGLPTIFGPVGGGQVAPGSLLCYFGKKRRDEWLRTRLMQLLPKIWLYRSRVKGFRMVFAANSETRRLLRDAGCEHVELLCDTGALPEHCLENPRTFVPTSEIRLLWVGRFVPRKGLALALDALALANPKVHLTIMGGGLTVEAMAAKIAERGLTGRVQWKGSRASWSEVREAYLSHDALLFSSLRDSFGSQNLEAMCSALPVISLNLGGVRDFISPDAGIKVDIGGTAQEVVRRLAGAIDSFAALSMEARNQMSSAALRCAHSFLWTERAALMCERYEQVLSTEVAYAGVTASEGIHELAAENAQSAAKEGVWTKPL